MKTRLQHIDIAKGIGILLVVAGHNWIVLGAKGELYRMVYSFHIPLFFILAGIFFNSKKAFVATLKEKSQTLLIPYFFTSVVVELIALAFNFKLDLFAKSLFWVVYGTGTQMRWVGFWFLTHLFLVSIFSWAVLNLFKKYNTGRFWQILLLLVFLTIGWLSIRSFWKMQIWGMKVNGLPFSADLLLISSFYFMLGSLSQGWIKERDFHLAPLAILGALFFGLHAFTDVTTDLNLRLYNNFPVATTLAISGSFIVIQISKFLARFTIAEKILGYFGRYSLIILIFHSFFQDNLFVFLSEYTKRFFYVGMATFTAAIIGSILVIEIINRVKFLQVIYRNSKAD
ncbi:MAG: acyltransferase family protein [Anaerolineales bacterium]|nr:acyltransferase family protein [Anaerolineales bacterium]